MNRLRILHVEDSADDADIVALALSGTTPACEITRVEDEPAYVAALEGGPDAIICDYHLPRFSAERALEILRSRGVEVPFLIVSHHINESEAVLAMQRGASDYLPKRDLGRLAKAIDAAIDRTRARRALAQSEAMKRGILDSLEARIAVLDGHGVILAVNRAWEAFQGRTPAGLGAISVGINYLALLQRVAASGNDYAQTAVDLIRDVIEGRRTSASVDYCYSDNDPRWFVARVVRLEGSQRSVVISHQEITDRMMAHFALESANKRLQVLSKRVLEVQEEERRVIAGELHDDVGQTLTALKIALHRITRDTDARWRPPLLDCIGITDQALEKIRRLALDIRPPQLDELGLLDALGALVERQRLATGLQIRWRVQAPEATRAPAALETACYRIAQEAISNASRHANARAIDVSVECDGALLKLCIHDDGMGFDAESVRREVQRTGHLGLIGMEERAQLAGGRLRVRSVPGNGTTVSAIFPLAGREARQA